MKNIYALPVAAALTAFGFQFSQAQRGEHSRPQGNISQNRSVPSRPSPAPIRSEVHVSNNNLPSRTFQPQPFGNSSRTPVSSVQSNRPGNSASVNRSVTYRHQDGRVDAVSNTRVISVNQQRRDVAVVGNRNNSYSRTNNSSVFQRNVYNRNPGYNRYNTRNVYNNNYRNNNYRNNNYRGSYYPRFYGYGPRYSVIPHSFLHISFGGNPYYYNNGWFYGSHGGYYQPLFPPPGISINILPFGYSRIFVGAYPYYYYNGIYYRQFDDEDRYQVVDAPMGATVSSLPRGAKSVLLNGEKLYELNGTYYKEDRDYKRNKVYTVVGKNGEVSNTDEVAADDQGNNYPGPLSNGTVLSQLPEGSKVVTINGDRLYVTPDNTYLKEESTGNTVQYTVVGQ